MTHFVLLPRNLELLMEAAQTLNFLARCTESEPAAGAAGVYLGGGLSGTSRKRNSRECSVVAVAQELRASGRAVLCRSAVALWFVTKP